MQPCVRGYVRACSASAGVCYTGCEDGKVGSPQDLDQIVRIGRSTGSEEELRVSAFRTSLIIHNVHRHMWYIKRLFCNYEKTLACSTCTSAERSILASSCGGVASFALFKPGDLPSSSSFQESSEVFWLEVGYGQWRKWELALGRERDGSAGSWGGGCETPRCNLTASEGFLRRCEHFVSTARWRPRKFNIQLSSKFLFLPLKYVDEKCAKISNVWY